jgi:hypothetical protein
MQLKQISGSLAAMPVATNGQQQKADAADQMQ